MKIVKLVLIGIVVLIAASLSLRAEKIYYSGGKIRNEKIVGRNESDILIERGARVEVLNLGRIERIVNDDGSVSKYDYEIWHQLAERNIQEKNYSEAVKIYGILLEAFPDNSNIHYLRGILNHKIGRDKDASQDYDFLVKHGEADEVILNNLGVIKAENKNFKKAEKWFNRAIAKNPEMVEARNNLAEVLRQKGDYMPAISEYQKVVKIEPDNIKAAYNLGFAYATVGDDQKAREQWEEALKLNPDDVEARVALENFNAGAGLVKKEENRNE